LNTQQCDRSVPAACYEVLTSDRDFAGTEVGGVYDLHLEELEAFAPYRRDCTRAR